MVGLGSGWNSCHQFPVVLSVCRFDNLSICFLGLIHHLLTVLSKVVVFLPASNFTSLNSSHGSYLFWLRIHHNYSCNGGQVLEKVFFIAVAYLKTLRKERKWDFVTGPSVLPQSFVKHRLLLVTLEGAQFTQSWAVLSPAGSCFTHACMKQVLV